MPEAYGKSIQIGITDRSCVTLCLTCYQLQYAIYTCCLMHRLWITEKRNFAHPTGKTHTACMCFDCVTGKAVWSVGDPLPLVHPVMLTYVMCNWKWVSLSLPQSECLLHPVKHFPLNFLLSIAVLRSFRSFERRSFLCVCDVELKAFCLGKAMIRDAGRRVKRGLWRCKKSWWWEEGSFSHFLAGSWWLSDSSIRSKRHTKTSSPWLPVLLREFMCHLHEACQTGSSAVVISLVFFSEWGKMIYIVNIMI